MLVKKTSPTICCQWVGKDLMYLYLLISIAFTIWMILFRNEKFQFYPALSGVNTFSGIVDEIYSNIIKGSACQVNFLGTVWANLNDQFI